MAYMTDTRRWGQGQAPHPGAVTDGVSDGYESTSAEALALTDDSRSGLVLFVLFATAVLVVTGAVALLALLNSWWVLGLAFGVDVLVTIVVGSAVFAVLSSGSAALSDGDRSSTDAAPTSHSQPAAGSSAHQTLPIAA